MSKEQEPKAPYGRTTDYRQRTPINVLFVCMGNICRSPMAEAVFKHLVVQAGLSDQFHIESVGTDAYHVGEQVHPGTRRILAKHDIPCDSTARQVTRADLAKADYIIALDRDNLGDLQSMMFHTSLAGKLHLLLSFVKGQRLQDVPDPYYTGNFEQVYDLVQVGCQGLLAYIRQERGI